MGKGKKKRGMEKVFSSSLLRFMFQYPTASTLRNVLNSFVGVRYYVIVTPDDLQSSLFTFDRPGSA